MQRDVRPVTRIGGRCSCRRRCWWTAEGSPGAAATQEPAAETGAEQCGRVLPRLVPDICG